MSKSHLVHLTQKNQKMTAVVRKKQRLSRSVSIPRDPGQPRYLRLSHLLNNPKHLVTVTALRRKSRTIDKQTLRLPPTPMTWHILRLPTTSRRKCHLVLRSNQTLACCTRRDREDWVSSLRSCQSTEPLPNHSSIFLPWLRMHHHLLLLHHSHRLLW